MRKFLINTLIACSLFSFTGIFDGGNLNYTYAETYNPTVYYTKSGSSYHLSRSCSTLKKSKNIYSGSLQSVKASRPDPCNICARGTGSYSGSSSESNSNKIEEIVIEEPIEIIVEEKVNVNVYELKKYLVTAYNKAFERDCDEEGLDYWISQFSEGKTTIRNFILNIIDTDEFNQKSKNLTDKIKRLYGVMFSRDADEDGLKYWESRLNENIKKYNNERQALIETSKTMAQADELKQIAKRLGVKY